MCRRAQRLHSVQSGVLAISAWAFSSLATAWNEFPFGTSDQRCGAADATTEPVFGERSSKGFSTKSVPGGRSQITPSLLLSGQNLRNPATHDILAHLQGRLLLRRNRLPRDDSFPA